jgi:hypothetical protein
MKFLLKNKAITVKKPLISLLFLMILSLNVFSQARSAELQSVFSQYGKPSPFGRNTNYDRLNSPNNPINSTPSFFSFIDKSSIFPIDKKYVLFSKITSNDEEIKVFLESVDVHVNALWQQENRFDYRYKFISEQVDSTTHYALFNQFLAKNKVLLLKTNLQTGFQEKIEGNLNTDMSIVDFRVLNGKCLIACDYAEHPVIAIFEGGKTFKILPNLTEKHSKILAFEIDKKRGTFHVILKNLRSNQLFVKTYTQDAQILNSFRWQYRGKFFNEAKAIDTGDGFLVIGTYNGRLQYHSRGVFTAKLNNDFSEEKIKFYEFADMKNLVKNLLEKQQNAKKINTFAILHELKELNGKVLFTADLFDANIKNQQLVPPAKYENALLCEFDKEGNLLWHNAISLQNFTSNRLKPLTNILVTETGILAGFQEQNTIQTTLIDAKSGEIITSGSYQEKELQQITGFSSWHDNAFLIWGKGTNSNPLKPNFYLRKLEVISQ